MEPTDEMLRKHVLNELDRIIGEIAVPMNTGLIATSIARQLKTVVAAWPDVTIRGPIERHGRNRMKIEGTITREIDGREVEIPFTINDNGSYFQWGHDTLLLGENAELLAALRDAAFEAVP